jgi:hypothetical protein
MMDSHKKVQEAACSAFASVAEHAGARLAPYLEGVCQVCGQREERCEERCEMRDEREREK